MRVKRRTVWLLTLFSLAAVISVYYVTDNSTKPFDGLAFFGDNLTDAREVARPSPIRVL